LARKKFSIGRAIFPLQIRNFFPEKKIGRKIFWEYVFKLIVAGIAQQQNCLKIGRNLCHGCGM